MAVFLPIFWQPAAISCLNVLLRTAVRVRGVLKPELGLETCQYLCFVRNRFSSKAWQNHLEIRGQEKTSEICDIQRSTLAFTF